jgi:hypothetical protein
MDLDNPVVKLCIEGTQAEFAGRPEDACALYWQAWNARKNDYDACIAAHYVARCQKTAEDIFHWNQEALTRAIAIRDGSVEEFYPSLYLNMGRSYEMLGNETETTRFYNLAARLGYIHQV